jgi:hypothetical protein
MQDNGIEIEKSKLVQQHGGVVSAAIIEFFSSHFKPR